MLQLTLSGLVVGRGRRALTRPIGLTLRAGEALLVTGPNGAGKSSFLRTLAGLLPPLAGTAAIEGARAADGEPARRPIEAGHYLGHRNALKPARPVGDELAFWAAFGRRAALRPAAALAAVGLEGTEALAVGALSAGQQRRAAFARLLVDDRPLWLLDEPTTALDAASQARIAELCRQRLASGGIVVAATHQPLDVGAARELALEPLARVQPATATGDDDGGWDEIG
ncbi:heme ABC exporter ATP-binding protein CcmA [Aureimonas flava]|uniref:Heme ABC exporter ATP-binding protein CcmA n=1 Tax=Aureimonas flava TaxID=2320271 RepID=A0A3A1WTC7_9HYPH|nr:heme ABC exporter ATP-binding protein CcmA [Aureimonas flava]RIY01005.1 heme ABC exporter ATP-binding protein CcmA [Aureimonas flava]